MIDRRYLPVVSDKLFQEFLLGGQLVQIVCDKTPIRVKGGSLQGVWFILINNPITGEMASFTKLDLEPKEFVGVFGLIEHAKKLGCKSVNIPLFEGEVRVLIEGKTGKQKWPA